MIVPPGKEKWGLRLEKAIYGTKQGSFLWAEHRDKLFKEYGLQPCPHDPTWFKKDFPGNNILMIQVHTDDGEIAADQPIVNEISKFFSWFNTKLDITTSETVGHFVGVRKEYGIGYATLDQEEYLKSKVLPCLEIKIHPNGEPCTKQTPWDNRYNEEFDSRRDPSESEKKFISSKNYYHVLGLLQYLGNTRGDILFTLSKLGQHSSNPRPVHWRAMQHLLAYLNGTRDTKILLRKSGEVKPFGHSDSDWASDSGTRRSMSGTVIMLSQAAIMASATLQKTIADSTVAAETIALNKLVKSALFLRNVLSWLGYNLQTATQLFCDNLGTVRNSEEGALRHKTKHMDIQYMFLRDQVKQENVSIHHIGTDKMIADILTKGLKWVKHNRCFEALGLIRGSVNNHISGIKP